MIRITRRAGALSAATLALALAAPLGASAVGAGPAHALEPFPRDYATWHQVALASSGGHAEVLTTDTLGRVWYSDDDNNELVRLDPLSGATEAFDLGASRPRIVALLPTPDGNIWLSDEEHAALIRLDPATGLQDSYAIGGFGGGPESMTVGPDGNIWFGDPSGGGLGRMDLAGSYSVIPDPTAAFVYQTTAAPDGRLWFTSQGSKSLRSYDPIADRFFELPVSVTSPVRDVAVSKKGDIWAVTEDGVAKIALDGTTIEFHGFTSGPARVNPKSLIAGEHAEMYFIAANEQIGRVDSAGATTFVRPPFAGYTPTSLTVDGFGSLWFNTDRGSTVGWV